MELKIKRLLSNTLLFTVANLGSRIMVFFMVPLYTMILTTEEYGVSDLVQTTAMLLFPVLSLSVSDAVLRFCFVKDYSTSDVLSVGLKVTLKGTFICFIVSLLLFFIPMFKPLGLYVLFIPIFYVTISYSNLLHKFARGIEKVRASAEGGLLSTVLVVAFNLLFLLVFKLGILGYLLAYSLAELVAIVYMACRCRINEYTVALSVDSDNVLQKQMLRYSLPLVQNSLSWWALSSINRYVMLAWLDVASVGIYSATLRIPTILNVLADIFAQAWLLTALKDYGDAESKQFINKMYRKYFWLLLTLTSVIILLSRPLARFLLTGEFSSYWWMIPYLFISVFLGALVGFLGSVFSAERKNQMQFISTLTGALFTIGITIIFLKNHGIIIAALATMVGYFVIWLIRRIAVKKYIKLDVKLSWTLVMLIILIVEAVLVGKGQYLYACLCLLLILVGASRDICSVVKFACIESFCIIIRKLNK